MKKTERGVTLIELLLFMALAAFIMMFGLNQYQSWRLDADRQQLAYNIDMLFQGMAKYYWANCSASTGSPLVVTPATVTSPVHPVSINMQTQLINNGFMAATDFVGGSTVPFNLAGASGLGSTQFNETTQSKNFCPLNNDLSPNCITPNSVGMIILWTIQISIQVDNPTTAAVLGSALLADCVSSSPTTCAPTGPSTTPAYLIFTRPPAYAAPNIQTDYWPSNQTARQFKKQYEDLPDWYLQNNAASTPAYYYCVN